MVWIDHGLVNKLQGNKKINLRAHKYKSRQY